MNNGKEQRLGEFIALVALMISMVALSIDIMLPALDYIGGDLGIDHENDRQLVITMLFFGLASGQIIYGPVSDSVGRKPPIYAGFAIFIIGSLVCIFAPNMEAMSVGRILQGLGVAAPRVIANALVRDQYKGREMAKVMSLVMAVFILVPAIAPAIGQGILLIADWRSIFTFLLLLAIIILFWFGIRQPETLSPEKRAPLSFSRVLTTVWEVCVNRIAIGYTIISGVIFGGFLGFLTSVQQIFQEQYSTGEKFPLYFAAVALSVGVASIINSRLVMKFGMRVMCSSAMVGIALFSSAFFAFAYVEQGHPAFWMLMVYLVLTFFFFGIVFGNLNALAMEPLGHIGGVGSAVVGSLSTLISLPLGAAIGMNYDGTVLPVLLGFSVLSMIAVVAMYITELGRKPDSESVAEA